LTLEALADVAARRTHDHAGIEAWTRAPGKPKRKARARQIGMHRRNDIGVTPV
jgi:hypothetical protein